MKELDSRTVGGKRGFWGPRCRPGACKFCSFALLHRESSCLDYIQTKVCVLFSGFLAWAAVSRLTTRGQAAPTVFPGAAGARKGHPGVIQSIRLPRTPRAPFIISLPVRSVNCSEGGRGADTLPLFIQFLCPPTHTHIHPEQEPGWAGGPC